MSYENKCGIKQFAMSGKNRRRWLIRKYTANILLIALFEIMSYSIYYYKVMKVYNMKCITSPLKSLPMFMNYPLNPPIIVFIIADIAVKIVFLSAISVIISAVSSKISYIYCILSGVAVTIPQLLYMLGYESMYNLSIGKYVAFLPAYNDGINSRIICYVLMTILLLAGSSLLYRTIKYDKV